MSVLVLMSTYNGEKYIKTQLDSILNQDYPDLEILIRDDGSTDMTLKIIQEYAVHYSNISWYTDRNIGVQKSFFDLIKNAEAGKDYYAFADQDDKWFPDKISRAVSILDEYCTEIPALYCSNKTIVDEELKILPVTVSSVIRKATFGNALVQNICTGCTAVINCYLMEIIHFHVPNYTIMHDWWLYLTASCFGIVYYDKKSYILYRQHSNNTLGAMLSQRNLLKYRIHQLFQPRGEIYCQVENFLNVFNTPQKAGLDYPGFIPDIPPENKKLAIDLLKSRRNLYYRLRNSINPQFFRQKTIDNIVLKLIMLIGKL